MHDHPFFRDTPRKAFDMGGHTVEYPILYYDMRFVLCFFATKTSRVRKVLPHVCLKPVEPFPGTTWLAIAAFEYRDTSIGPYNELAVAFPVRFGQKAPIPVLAAASMLLKGAFAAYVYHLPVTTAIAEKAGVLFHDYPKFLADITFTDQNDERLVVVLCDKEGMILRMTTKRPAVHKSKKFQFSTYTVRDNRITHSVADGFTPHIGAMIGNVATLEFGEHPVGKELAALQPSKVAHIGLYAEGALAKLHQPDARWQADTLGLLRMSLL